MNPPLTVKPPMRTVVLATSSCSQRKYQGAFAGFGVTAGLAACSRGASKRTLSEQRHIEDE